MDIKTSEFVISSARADKCPNSNLPEFAFIGRSNVGKSSLINMLTGKKSLAQTSATPGKTVLINHYLINKEWHLVDLPGYGYAQLGMRDRDKLKKLINYYVLGRQQLVCLFVLIDSRIKPQKIDLEFIEMLGENGVPFAMIFTKCEKLGKNALKNNIDAFLDKMKEQWEELPPHFVTSSTAKIGKEEVLSYIESIIKSLNQE